MIDERTAPFAALLLRLGLGVVFLAHGLWLEALAFAPPGAASSAGLPGPLAYVLFAAETVGGVLLIIGVHTRWVALALLPLPLAAIWMPAPNGWLFTDPNGGLAYPLFPALAAGVQALLGDGAYAMGGRTADAPLARA